MPLMLFVPTSLRKRQRGTEAGGGGGGRTSSVPTCASKNIDSGKKCVDACKEEGDSGSTYQKSGAGSAMCSCSSGLLCDDGGGAGGGAGLAVFLVFLTLCGIGAGGWVYYRKKQRQPLLPDCMKKYMEKYGGSSKASGYVAAP